MLRCQCLSVCPSVSLPVTEVHWHMIANLGFKFQCKLTAHCGHSPQCARAMLATARPSCSQSACRAEHVALWLHSMRKCFQLITVATEAILMLANLMQISI